MSDHDDDMDRRLKDMANRITVPPRPDLTNVQAQPSRLHRPWLRAVAAACVLSLAGVAAFAVIDSRDSDVSVNTGSAPGPSASSGPTAELRQLLIDLGVDVDRAPSEVLDAGEAQICGSANARSDLTAGEVERRCFLDAHLAHVPAVLVEIGVTVEGDPVVTVHRTTSTGEYTAAHDATRDSFGSGDWDVYTCDRLTTRIPGAPQGFSTVEFSPSDTCTDVEGRADASTVPSLGPAPDVPRWFSDRPDLPLCGIDVRIEDNDREHRSCFRQAVEAGTPAEFAYTSTGDEGEMGAFWYRSLGPSDIEVFERQLPEPGMPGAWVRYACTSAGFLDEPGSEVDLLPFSHAGTDCTRVEDGVPPVDRVLSTSGGRTAFFASAESGDRTLGLILDGAGDDVSVVSFDLPTSDEYAPSATQADDDGWYVLAPGCLDGPTSCGDGQATILALPDGSDVPEHVTVLDISGEAAILGAIDGQLIVNVLGDDGSRILLVDAETGDTQDLEWRPPSYSATEIRTKARESQSGESFDIPRTSYCVAPHMLWALTSPAIIDGQQTAPDSLTPISISSDQVPTSVPTTERLQRSADSVTCTDERFSTFVRSEGTVVGNTLDSNGVGSEQVIYEAATPDGELVVSTASRGAVFADLLAPVESDSSATDPGADPTAAPPLPPGRVVVATDAGPSSVVVRGVSQTSRLELSQDGLLVLVASPNRFTIQDVR